MGNLLAFARVAGKGIARENIPRMAASLSYTSLLALVPLISIALAILAAFPAFDGVRSRMMEWAVETFLPYQVGEIQDRIEAFVGAAAGLTAIGVVGLAVTAIMLLVTIESALNTIFQVEKPRHPIARIQVYWAVLTIGPLLMGVSFSLSSYLAAARSLVSHDVIAPITGLLPALGPHILTMVAMSLLYILVPNRPVRVRHAVLGGLVATVLSAGLRQGFLLYVTSGQSYETLYGALAVLPIFLIWMYLSWVVVLLGAVTAANLPNWHAIRRLEREGADVAGLRLGLALATLVMLARAHEAGGPVTRRDLLREVAASDTRLGQVLRSLREAGLVAIDESGGLLPARDPRAMTLSTVIQALGHGVPRTLPPGGLGGVGWAPLAREALTRAADAEDAALSTTVHDLARATARTKATREAEI
ncbi:MAG: YihY family inner membrane protein [Rhodospirillum sp.]|nr:YihY family inner membrane protein [Rhodospirillum sp.]MCF8489785.1 YihY family inner membrane protein [Rhodospirillum sp.]MCF8500497.1 YihY family inner membrane protein [Rhodospirillum sp.]